MRRTFRLRSSADFQVVRRKGKKYRNRLLVVFVAPNGRTHTRFGFVVGKKRGKAVVRNKLKRRLREAARLKLAAGRVRPGYDVVIIPRGEATRVDYHALDEALEEVLARAHVLVNSSDLAAKAAQTDS
ncbi:MAG: ribonuclease P protein component [Ardenticatenia bacterium]|nr:ribonuclease P protein component [Ardenticatenia bacterium]